MAMPESEDVDPQHHDTPPDDQAQEGETPKKRTRKKPPIIFPSDRAWRFPLTEIDVAHRVVLQHGNEIRWCLEEQLLYVWNGKHWKSEPDTHGHTYRVVKKVITGLLAEAAKIKDDGLREKAAKFAWQMQKHAAISAVIQIVKSEVNISMNDFDRDPWLFNVQNGTLDLRTGELHEARREDYITRVANVTHDPAAKCPEWQDFISWRCLGSPGYAAFKQRFLGSVLTGIVKDQRVIIDYGEGANGKSTEYGAMQRLMGTEYAIAISADSLMSNARRKGSDATPDIIALKGARLAVAGEGEEGQHLAEGLVKLLSGGDVITARPLYGKQVNFEASHKLVMFTNHKPVVRDMGHGIWRRLTQMPSAANIDEDAAAGRRVKRDMNPVFDVEMAGILNWLIAGCLEWQRNGLGTCDEVVAATRAYQREMDLIGAFIVDYLGSKDSVEGLTVKEVYEAYRAWSEESGRGRTTMAKQRFDDDLKKRGATTRQGHSRMTYWDGLKKVLDKALQQEGQDNEPPPPPFTQAPPMGATLVVYSGVACLKCNRQIPDADIITTDNGFRSFTCCKMSQNADRRMV